MMKMNFPDLPESSCESILRKGESVLVVGASPRRGHLIVEHNNTTLHVPFQYMELVKHTSPILSPVNINNSNLSPAPLNI